MDGTAPISCQAVHRQERRASTPAARTDGEASAKAASVAAATVGRAPSASAACARVPASPGSSTRAYWLARWLQEPAGNRDVIQIIIHIIDCQYPVLAPSCVVCHVQHQSMKCGFQVLDCLRCLPRCLVSAKAHLRKTARLPSRPLLCRPPPPAAGGMTHRGRHPAAAAARPQSGRRWSAAARRRALASPMARPTTSPVLSPASPPPAAAAKGGEFSAGPDHTQTLIALE